jgi:hypothetical protein
MADLLSEEHTCARIIKDDLLIWKVRTIWEYVMLEKLPIISRDIVSFNQEINPWFYEREAFVLKNIIKHYKRVVESDLAYPIILDPEGNILDGVHRFVKAVAYEHQYIKCIQLVNYPMPDEIK